MSTTEVLRTLDAHGPFMSDADEEDIIRRVGTTDDVADLALRTCMCGRRLDGFDDYFEHLRAVLGAATQRP
jgi:hypothetical protein